MCNETNLGTESGSADIEVVWTPNTINTQWYTGYGANTAAANATTCSYGGTINLPQTNPSRAGYAFAGWKLRVPNILLSLDTSIDAGPFVAGINLDEDIYPDSQTAASYGLTEPGTYVLNFSYGDIYLEASCNSTSVSGGDLIIAAENIEQQNLTDEEYDAQSAQLLANFNYVTRPGNTFSRGSNGNICWCRVYGYKPTNGTMQSTPAAPWLLFGDVTASSYESCDAEDNCVTVHPSCSEYCFAYCVEPMSGLARIRALLYGQQ